MGLAAGWLYAIPLMTDGGPILEYSRAPRRRALPWQAIVGLVLLLLSTATTCMCGHMDWVAVPFTVGAAAMSWWAFIRKKVTAAWRLVILVLVVCASLAVMKNAADILWFGHEPLLR